MDFLENATGRRTRYYTPSLEPAQMEDRTLITIPEESELPLPTLPIALDDVVEGTLKDEFIVLTGVFGGDDGNPAIADPAARKLNVGKGTVASYVLKAGGEVKTSITKKKPPKYLVVGHAPGNDKIRNARKQGVPMITVKGLATVLSGSKEKPEQANLHGVRYSDGYKKVVEPEPAPVRESPTPPDGGADFLGEASSSAMAVTSPQPDARK